ncbi:WD repeat-containing protein 26 [Hypocenomyce scalaris]|nr:WD repeat-containing protein 26 [Hypocenomyce scalaris]
MLRLPFHPLLLLLVTSPYPPLSNADAIPITALSLYSEAGLDVQLCVYSQFTDYQTTYDCTDPNNQASCMCTDSSSSYRVASAISSCALVVIDTPSQSSTATQIWADFCLTDGGVSAVDETLLQDFKLYNEMTFPIQFCATSITSAYSTSLGCEFVAPASCLCGNSQSSQAMAAAMSSCASAGVYPQVSLASSITELLDQYCSANLQTSTFRELGVSVTLTMAAGARATSSAAPGAAGTAGLGSPATATSVPTSPSSTGTGSGSHSSSSSSSDLSTGANISIAVGSALGAAILTILATWYRPQQIGRFITCGRWPAKTQSRDDARNQVGRVLAAPVTMVVNIFHGPSAHLHGHWDGEGQGGGRGNNGGGAGGGEWGNGGGGGHGYGQAGYGPLQGGQGGYAMRSIGS